MSLKAFHVLFVAASAVLGLGFGVWAVRGFQRSQETALLWMAIGGFASAAFLLVYGRWFLRKLNNGSPG